MNHYSLPFSSSQWEELICMSFEPFEFGEGDSLTRGQWMALAHMALGKAQRIESGDYGADPSSDDDGVDLVAWAEELREIAQVILAKFQPGDGQT